MKTIAKLSLSLLIATVIPAFGDLSEASAQDDIATYIDGFTTQSTCRDFERTHDGDTSSYLIFSLRSNGDAFIEWDNYEYTGKFNSSTLTFHGEDTSLSELLIDATFGRVASGYEIRTLTIRNDEGAIKQHNIFRAGNFLRARVNYGSNGQPTSHSQYNYSVYNGLIRLVSSVHSGTRGSPSSADFLQTESKNFVKYNSQGVRTNSISASRYKTGSTPWTTSTARYCIERKIGDLLGILDQSIQSGALYDDIPLNFYETIQSPSDYPKIDAIAKPYKSETIYAPTSDINNPYVDTDELHYTRNAAGNFEPYAITQIYGKDAFIVRGAPDKLSSETNDIRFKSDRPQVTWSKYQYTNGYRVELWPGNAQLAPDSLEQSRGLHFLVPGLNEDGLERMFVKGIADYPRIRQVTLPINGVNKLLLVSIDAAGQVGLRNMPRPGPDRNGDRIIDDRDLEIVRDTLGTNQAAGDVNGDGKVDINDINGVNNARTR